MSFPSIRKFVVYSALATASATPALAAPVNINSADASMMAESLNGIGPKLAAAIVAYRKQNGPFKSLEDLAKVRGVGPQVVERNRLDILIDEQPANADTR